VFFCSRIGLQEYFDKDMGIVIRWADDLTGGFDHEFLPEAGEIKDTRFRSVDNPSVTAALKTFAPEVVMVYGYIQLTALRALTWCRMHGVPVLMTTDSNAVTTRSPVKRFLRQMVLRPVLAQVSGFLTVGDQNEEALARLGVPQRKMHRSAFTIDERRYRDVRSQLAARRARIRREHSIPNDAFVGITVGKLIARKRTEDAVQAFAAVASTGKLGRRDARLLVCGNGPDLEMVKGLVRAGAPAILAGFVNVDRLPDHFAAADILVHPAGRDPHPLICSEAACMGLPMILSDRVGTIGPTDISRRGENALIYPCGDISALADCIVRLAEDGHLLAEMSKASLRIFDECNLTASVEGFMRALKAVSSRNMAT
jgi:glycosyltransferase involved in cell wall biosynthesis